LVRSFPMDDVTELDATDTAEHSDDALLDDELLVEEISIDGMCGVY
jgi:mycofactocin precursor